MLYGESAITGLKHLSEKKVVAFLLSGPMLTGVPNVLRELCGCECIIIENFFFVSKCTVYYMLHTSTLKQDL